MARKNERLVAGIPLLGGAISKARQAAIRSGGKVVCSTEDDRLATIAREWGAETPFVRPDHLASDGASTIDVVLHAAEAMGLSEDTMIVLVQATSPLATAEDLLGVLNTALKSNLPAVAVAAAPFPKAWMWRVDSSGHLQVETQTGHQRQEHAVCYVPTGAAYAATVGHLRNHRSFVLPEAMAAIMPPAHSLDLDSEEELDVAEAIARRRAPGAMAFGKRQVGPGHSCFVIAEAGVNHNGQLDMALRLVEAAAQAGADAVKFQTFQTARAIRKGTPKAEYQVGTTGGGTMEDMVRALELSPEDHQRLWEHASKQGISIFSSPFDSDSVDLLVRLGVDVIKLASGEITNLFLLERVAATRLPLIMSTGMSTMAEISHALNTLDALGAGPVALLHCVSSYPAPAHSLNLAAMAEMQAAFSRPVGWSDHSLGPAASVAAVAMGATIVEKHLTLDNTLVGPDHAASMEPAAFREMVVQIREVETMRGQAHKGPQQEELDVRALARRSLVAARTLKAGTVLLREHLDSKRPGSGLSPMAVGSVLGRTLKVDVAEDDFVLDEHVS